MGNPLPDQVDATAGSSTPPALPKPAHREELLTLARQSFQLVDQLAITGKLDLSDALPVLSLLTRLTVRLKEVPLG